MIGETFGNFKIVKKLGRGGMGEVYLAEQQSIETKVAIKVLHAEISADKEHVQRFFNEARAVSRIHHAGIVKIFDVGFHASGYAYLIMEYLDGETLAKRIDRQGRLSVPQIADIGRQIASVLDATHSAGITHRDLKPDNIFIIPDRELASRERVKILDFGIAKLTGTLASSSPATIGTMGTPAYMAPEQWGDSAKVDWRADVYSLGCVAFEMACGRPPFIVTNIAEACAKHLSEPPPLARTLMPDVPPRLERLLNRLLDKDPGSRPQSMEEITREFEAVGGSGASSTVGPTVGSFPALDPSVVGAAPTMGATMPTGISPPPPRAPNTTLGAAASQSIAQPRRRSRGLMFVVVGCLAAVAAGAVYMAMRGGDSRNKQAQVATAPQPPEPAKPTPEPAKPAPDPAQQPGSAGSAEPAKPPPADPSKHAGSGDAAKPGSGDATKHAGSGDAHGSADTKHAGSADTKHAGSAETHAGSADTKHAGSGDAKHAGSGDTHAGSGDTHAGSADAGKPHQDPTVCLTHPEHPACKSLPESPSHAHMMSTLKTVEPKIHECHDKLPTVRAVRLHLNIEPDGTVSRADVTTARGAHNAVTECVDAIVKHLHFPKSKLGAPFSHLISFAPPAGGPPPPE